MKIDKKAMRPYCRVMADEVPPGPACKSLATWHNKARSWDRDPWPSRYGPFESGNLRVSAPPGSSGDPDRGAAQAVCCEPTLAQKSPHGSAGQAPTPAHPRPVLNGAGGGWPLSSFPPNHVGPPYTPGGGSMDRGFRNGLPTFSVPGESNQPVPGMMSSGRPPPTRVGAKPCATVPQKPFRPSILRIQKIEFRRGGKIALK